MKKLLFALAVLLANSAMSQPGTNVTYVPTDQSFVNPERGLYHHESAKASNYQQLDVTDLNSYRTDGISLVLRIFQFDSFLTTPISAAYLTKMQTDFNRLRTTKMKCVVRFTYSDDNNAGSNNASKAIILQHIVQLRPILELNKDVIACFQAGFIGAWGEWYYTDGFGTSNLTPQNYADRLEVINAMMTNFPAERQIQVRTPVIKQKLTGSIVAITASQAYQNTLVGRLAHHNDCFVASSSDQGTYQNVAVEYPWLEAENKYLAMGGETCGVSTFSACDNTLNKLNKFSWDYLNIDYHPDVIAGWEDGLCFDEIKRRLGYRFEFINSTLDQNNITINLRNVGFGHLFNQRNVYIVYRNGVTGTEYKWQIETDPRLWFKDATITLNTQIPVGLASGSYNVYLEMPDYLIDDPGYSIRFANENVWEQVTGYNSLLLTVQVESPLNVAVFVKDGVLYTNLQKYSIQLFDLVGKLVSSDGTTVGLSTGIYIAKVTTDKNVYTKKITITNK